MEKRPFNDGCIQGSRSLSPAIPFLETERGREIRIGADRYPVLFLISLRGTVRVDFVP